MESNTNRPGLEGPVTAGWGNVVTAHGADEASQHTDSLDVPLPRGDAAVWEEIVKMRTTFSDRTSLSSQDEPTEWE